MISAIAAVASNGMLGLNNWLPWDIPEELAYFEETVANAAIVVGRQTYDSMAVVQADTFVVSRNPDLVLRAGCQRMETVEQALSGALATGKPVFVIGGASIYRAAWPYCHRFFLTRIGMAFEGDVEFPPEIPVDRWQLLSRVERRLLERKSGGQVNCSFCVHEQALPRSLTGLERLPES